MWVLIIIGLVFLLIYWPIGVTLIIVGLILWAIGKSKQSKGIPMAAEKKCPRCAEIIKAEALICRFCSYEFPADAPIESVPAPQEALRACPKCGTMTNSASPECRSCHFRLGS